MANRRFIDFPIASSVGDSDIILIWQSGANKQTTKATFLSGLPENLDELNDVAISGLTNGQILRYDSVTGKWENTDQGNLDLNDLNDVSIVSPSNGQVLVYNSSTSKWENSSGGYVPYTGAVTTVNLGAQTIQAGSFVKAGGTSAQFLKADGSVDSNTYGTGTVTSVALTMPTAFSVANSPVTTAGTLAVTGAGTVGQYIRGDGSLADFPESSGGGSSVSYYLNGSVSQGTIGGVAYKEMNKVPILGAGTDFTINADGYIASFITDAGDPNLLEIPGGNWNFETYFSASSSGGTPSFYVELYKVNSGGTATLIASNSGFPELIAFGTNIISYFSTLAVPTTALALTDRLAIRYYVTHSGRTITLHTEDNHLCQIITTFTTGLTALNGLTAQIQNFAVGTSGTDFAIASATATHTFNLPTASATNRGALSSADWSIFNGKQNALTNPVTGTGTTNYLPKFTGASTIGNSVIQESGGLIGIGSTPSYLLNVISVLDGSLLEIKSTATANNTALRIGIDANNAFINATGGSTGILEFRTYGSTKAIITQTGNVLIGNPPAADNGARLQVSGSSRLLDLIGGGDSFARVTGNRGNANDLHVANLEFYNSNSSRLVGEIRGITGTGGTQSNSGQLTFYTNNNGTYAERMRITSAGQLLINSQTSANDNVFKFFIDSTFASIQATYNTTGSYVPMRFLTSDVERMRIDSSGNVLVGTTTTDVSTVGIQLRNIGLGIFVRSGGSTLQLNRTSSDGIIASFRTSDVERGSISISGSVTSYNVTSDYRLKEDFKEINGLEKVNAIKVYDYKWKSDNKRMHGVLAHELGEVLPYAVFGEKDELDEYGNYRMQSVDYSKIVPVMVKAIQELKQEIDTLKK